LAQNKTKSKRKMKQRRDSALDHDGNLVFVPPRGIDFKILLITILMLGFGLVMLFSASMTRGFFMEDSPSFYVGRQVIFTAIGLALVYLLTRRDVRKATSFNTMLLAYVAVTIMLVLVLIPGIGIKVNDQRRWLPFILRQTFQPSELAKMAVVFCGACYYPWLRKQRAAGKFCGTTLSRSIWLDFFMDFGVPGLAIFLWCGLIMMQSHFSATLIILLELLVVFLSAGISKSSWRRLALILVITILVGTFIFVVAWPAIRAGMSGNPRMDHIVDRLDAFTGKSSNDTSYQPDQALIAIGSGGFRGLGLGMGVQKYNYLPEAHNDYIYAIICEELGFVGGSVVIALFAAYLIYGLRVTFRTRTLAAQILASGFSSLIVIQAMLSIAVNLQVIPSTGVSLPFFSYGGTSNIFFLVGVALLLNVSKFGLVSQTPADRADD
jgi:cell division protein FtsW